MVFRGKKYNGIESYVKGSVEWKSLLPGRKMPRHGVIHRGMVKLSLLHIRKIMRLVVAKYRRHGITVSFSSSGFPPPL